MGKRGPKARDFDSLIDKTGECWLWTGSTFSGRYGRVHVDGKALLAHRYSYEKANGPIPDGLFVCHRCDVPLCVRPDHLFLGTPADNLADMVKKGRSLRGVRNAHAKLTDAAVAEILTVYPQGNVTQKQLADRFGVVEGAIWNVLHGASWRHVDA